MVTADVALGKHHALGGFTPTSQTKATKRLANGKANSIERHIVWVENAVTACALQELKAYAHQ